MNWAYGVTTVPERFETVLPRTLASLAKAGFDNPRLFIDGPGEIPAALRQYQFSQRVPKLRAFGNWLLAIQELVVLEPTADRYAIFQDDMVTYINLRQYLNQCQYPDKGYLNLYTFPSQTKDINGWYLSTQGGKGAVGLVFNRDALLALFSSNYMINRPFDLRRGHKSIDGGIVTAMNNMGWQEYVHNPSLVQHTGIQSAIGNSPQPFAPTFKGEDFDAVQLLGSG